MTPELAKALVAAQTQMPAVEKSRTAEVTTKSGGKYTYTYSTLDQLIALTRPILNANGLSITQFPVAVEGGIGLQTTLMHVSGEYLAATMPLIGSMATAQELGSALTYARRYAWAAALGIASEEDDDGAGASKRGGGTTGAGPRRAREQHKTAHPEPAAAAPSAARLLELATELGAHDSTLEAVRKHVAEDEDAGEDWIARAIAAAEKNLEAKRNG